METEKEIKEQENTDGNRKIALLFTSFEIIVVEMSIWTSITVINYLPDNKNVLTRHHAQGTVGLTDTSSPHCGKRQTNKRRHILALEKQKQI